MDNIENSDLGPFRQSIPTHSGSFRVQYLRILPPAANIFTRNGGQFTAGGYGRGPENTILVALKIVEATLPTVETI